MEAVRLILVLPLLVQDALAFRQGFLKRRLHAGWLLWQLPFDVTPPTSVFNRLSALRLRVMCLAGW